MKVHVLKTIRVDRLGTLKPGTEVDMHPSVALQFLKQGAVEAYETKVVRLTPSQAAGIPSSVSPAAQASPSQTSPPSVAGGKKKSKKSAASL